MSKNRRNKLIFIGVCGIIYNISTTVEKVKK